MKYDNWDDMIDTQATAFAMLCSQNARMNELANKADDGYNHMSKAEQAEFIKLSDEIFENPFFSNRCEKEWEDMEEQENPDILEERPNSWDPLEEESYVDLFGPWWE